MTPRRANRLARWTYYTKISAEAGMTHSIQHPRGRLAVFAAFRCQQLLALLNVTNYITWLVEVAAHMRVDCQIIAQSADKLK